MAQSLKDQVRIINAFRNGEKIIGRMFGNPYTETFEVKDYKQYEGKPNTPFEWGNFHYYIKGDS